MENHWLRKSTEADLDVFFTNQLDEEAGYMAAFTAKDPTDREAYMTKWKRLLADETVTHHTIISDGLIAGSVSTYQMFGETQVSYWIGREFWGRGIASFALTALLKTVETRPLFGRAAADNAASRRVMEKCGFVISGYERGFANARNMEIDEVVYKLEK